MYLFINPSLGCSALTFVFASCSKPEFLFAKVHADPGKHVFMFSAPRARNHSEIDSQPDELIQTRAFKNVVKGLEEGLLMFLSCLLRVITASFHLCVCFIFMLEHCTAIMQSV